MSKYNKKTLNRDPQDIANVAVWAVTGHTGTSSKALAYEFLTGNPDGQYASPPWDMADFKRCAWLIERVPAVRQSVDTLAEKCPKWAGLAPIWDELTSILETDDRDKIKAGYEMIQKALKEHDTSIDMGNGIRISFGPR